MLSFGYQARALALTRYTRYAASCTAHQACQAVTDPSDTFRSQLSGAYHSYAFVAAYIYGAKFEMHVHHAVTVALIFLSNWLGFRQVGAVVLFLHDVPDIFGSAVKGKGATAVGIRSANCCHQVLSLPRTCPSRCYVTLAF